MNAPATIKFFGQTLNLRGSNEIAASWSGELSGGRLYVMASNLGEWLASFSVRDSESGRFISVARVAGQSNLEAAEQGLLAALRAQGLKA